MSKRTMNLRGNARLCAGMQQLRRSGATSPYDPRPHRQRSRNDAKRTAIRESYA